jgi:uncharacterized protein (TIGR02145 family)
MGSVEELKKLAPQGWRIPTEGEWRELLEAHGLQFDGDGNIVYDDEQKVRAAVEALLGGPFKGALGGTRDSKGRFDGSNVFWCTAGNSYVFVTEQHDITLMYTMYGRVGYYVRCVRDKPPTQ